MKYELDLMMMRKMGYEEGKEAAQEEINSMRYRAEKAEEENIKLRQLVEGVGLLPCKLN